MSLNPSEKTIKKPTYNNDIKEIRHERQLDKLNLSFESPRMKKAMDDLGIPLHETFRKDKSHFEKKGLEPEIAELRYKHY
jgi:hypothetical protein